MSAHLCEELMKNLPYGGAVLEVVVVLDADGQVRDCLAQMQVKAPKKEKEIISTGVSEGCQFYYSTGEEGERRVVALSAKWPAELQTIVAGNARLAVPE